LARRAGGGSGLLILTLIAGLCWDAIVREGFKVDTDAGGRSFPKADTFGVGEACADIEAFALVFTGECTHHAEVFAFAFNGFKDVDLSVEVTFAFEEGLPAVFLIGALSKKAIGFVAKAIHDSLEALSLSFEVEVLSKETVGFEGWAEDDRRLELGDEVAEEL